MSYPINDLFKGQAARIMSSYKETDMMREALENLQKSEDTEKDNELENEEVKEEEVQKSETELQLEILNTPFDTNLFKSEDNEQE